jgi:hypothetical protein
VKEWYLFLLVGRVFIFILVGFVVFAITSYTTGGKRSGRSLRPLTRCAGDMSNINCIVIRTAGFDLETNSLEGRRKGSGAYAGLKNVVLWKEVCWRWTSY